MLSALILSAGRQPAVLLAEQLAHESCVRPGPLVLGTAPLKSPTPTVDRDRTVSRVLPRISAGTDYTFTLFRGAGVLGDLKTFHIGRDRLLSKSIGESRYGGQTSHATHMLLDICGGDPLRFRIV